MTALSIDHTTQAQAQTASAVNSAFIAADAQDKARSVRLAAAQQRRAAARARDLAALLRNRPDLAGVHAPADFAIESVRWCA